mgnify:CR=1 FL=1
MMKKILACIFAIAPQILMAQNVWEKPDTQKEQPAQTTTTVKQPTKKDLQRQADLPYLKGNIPVIDGRVEFDTTICCTGKSAEDIYEHMLKYMTDMTKQQNQTKESIVSLVNKQEHIIVARLNEWMVFKANFISLDRTLMNYTFVATCRDGAIDLKLYRISYRYNTAGKEETYTAEEWITDEYAVNKKNTKLLPITGKFRRKTIDRVHQIFNDINAKFAL